MSPRSYVCVCPLHGDKHSDVGTKHSEKEQVRSLKLSPPLQKPIWNRRLKFPKKRKEKTTPLIYTKVPLRIVGNQSNRVS